MEWGANTNAVPPVHYGYTKGKTHAEINAFKKARGVLEEGAFSTVNIRLNKSGELRMAAPCRQCHEILTALGCTTFWFSTNSGFARLA